LLFRATEGQGLFGRLEEAKVPDGIVKVLAQDGEPHVEHLGRMGQLLATQHSQGMDILVAQLVLAALAPVGDDADGASPHTQGEVGEQVAPLIIGGGPGVHDAGDGGERLEDRKSTRLNSSHVKISYAVFCLKKKKI